VRDTEVSGTSDNKKTQTFPPVKLKRRERKEHDERPVRDGAGNRSCLQKLESDRSRETEKEQGQNIPVPLSPASIS
jgi:hypothetical protein